MIRSATLGGVAAHSRALVRTTMQRPGGSPSGSRFAWALLATLSLLACDGENGPTTPFVEQTSTPTPPSNPDPLPALALADAEIRLVAGDDQEGEVGMSLGTPVTVEVTDTLGAPIEGVPVEWVFTHGAGRSSGSVGSATASFIVPTDSIGRSAVDWELGTTPGNQTASAGIVLPPSVSAPSDPANAPRNGWGRWREFRARAKAGAIRTVTIAPDTISLAEGESAQLSASTTDRYGNPVESNAVEWSSTDESVVTTTSAGMVHYAGAGAASVMAEANGRQGSAAVTSMGPDVNATPLAGITGPSQDTTIVLGDAVTFRGSATDDDGSVASHAWTFGDGTSTSDAAPAPHTYANEGSYDVTYVVTDDEGLQSAEASLSIAVVSPTNVIPDASIDSPVSDITVTLGTPVNFTGSASDSDGTVDSHLWRFGDGSTSESEDPGQYTYGSAGSYSVTYRVWDDRGGRSQVARRTVTVEAPNQAPTANISSPAGNPTITVGQSVNFLGSASDPDGSIAQHEWSFGDGSTSSAQNPGQHTYSQPGSYTVTYRVIDNDDAVSSDVQRFVTVQAVPNQAPAASISSPASNVTITLGDDVDFRGTASDTDGSVATHSWTFGDGSTASVEDPGSHTYASAGSYTATYRVWDDDGAVSPVAQRTVTVEAVSNQAPTASMISPASNVTITAGGVVDFQGSASDPDGSVASHSWSFGDGTTSSAEDPGSRVYSSPGSYTVTYSVRDDQGANSPVVSRTVTVQSAPPPPPDPDDLVFTADWDQGLGMSTTAFSDGGQFDEWGGGAEYGGFEVKSTASSGRDFSTPNYLSIDMVNGEDWIDMTTRNWATPQVGETVSASWEMRWTSPVGGQTTHGFYFDPDFGGENWGPPTLGLSIEDNANNWQMSVWTSPSASPDLGQIRTQQMFPLNKSETYAVTLSYTRVSSSEFRIGFEVRNMAGALVLDSADFGDYEWYAGTRKLSNTTFTQSGAGAQGVSGFRIGNNGLDVKTGSNQAIAEVANFQVHITGG